MIWPIVMVYKWYIDKGQLFRNQKPIQNIITKYIILKVICFINETKYFSALTLNF